MPKIREKLPIQYTGLDGVAPAKDNLGAAGRGSTLSMYVGGSGTTRYRQVSIGYGERSDFTKLNAKDKSEAKYDYEKFGSISYQAKIDKQKSTRKSDTFYSCFKQYEKAVVPTGL